MVIVDLRCSVVTHDRCCYSVDQSVLLDGTFTYTIYAIPHRDLHALTLLFGDFIGLRLSIRYDSLLTPLLIP